MSLRRNAGRSSGVWPCVAPRLPELWMSSFSFFSMPWGRRFWRGLMWSVWPCTPWHCSDWMGERFPLLPADVHTGDLCVRITEMGHLCAVGPVGLLHRPGCPDVVHRAVAADSSNGSAYCPSV